MTGLARPRQWDATVRVEIPELEGETAGELGLVAFPDDVIASDELPVEVRDRIAAALDEEVDRPYETLLVRSGPTAWAAGARRVNAELVRLPGVEAECLEVAVAPNGERSGAVDGTSIGGLVEPAVDAALRELERSGRTRFQAFAARADNLDGERWQLTIDPL